MRSAEAIDATARTLLLQIEVDNAKGDLLPGSYAQVHLQVVGAGGLRVPVNTLIFRGDGLQVATVTADKRILLKQIVIGRDYGTEVEVVSGLNSDDLVILNPPDAIVNQQQVRLASDIERVKEKSATENVKP
jgi:membrane fusion protein, multidrug efflux system